MRFILPFLILSINVFSQSSVHYIGPVHSNQKNTLYAKEQYIYVTSPYNEGPVYVKISEFGTFQTNRLEMDIGRSISYKVGEDDETPLVITTEDLGKNLSDKGMKVEGFKDYALTQPIPIFVETRFQAGNYEANPQTQYTSWNEGEPNDCCNDSEDGQEDYTHIWFNGLWNDLYNTDNLPFVIEFDYNIENLGNNYIFLGLFDGHSYFISNFKRNWGESRNIAISLGGYLVSINTQEEQNKIVEWFNELQEQEEDLFTYNNYGPWIGLFQDSSDPLYSEPSGGWRWDDGSSLNYFERQQANSSFLKGESAPGRTFRLGHGITNIQSTHRRVFFTALAVEEGNTNVTLSELGSGWEHVLGNTEDYEIDSEGNYTFSLSQYQTHAFALDNVPGSPEQNLDALVGALVESDKNIVINVGFWGGSNSWQGNGRDIGFDQIKPIDNVSNEYIFMRAAGQINVNGQPSNTNEYPIIVAHEDNTRLWLYTNAEDTSTTAPDYILNKGEYQVLYFGQQNVSTEEHIYLLSNKRVYGYQNMAGQDGSATKQAMMLVNGINPMASNKIDGIYNIEDIASTKFEMSLKILTSTGADLKLNDLEANIFNPITEEIIGREDFSWYYFDNNDLETILPLGPNKRLTIESDGPVYGQYYGYNAVQGLAGYFYSYSDFDKDGITDADDLDDDNDGILDVWEGDLDNDGDGLLNRYDLDSDGDGCYDVVEAGFTDHDDNGILGYGTSQGVYVDSKGRVIKNNDNTDVLDGYTYPVDRDNNFTDDFRESGFQVNIIKHPQDILLDPCPDADNDDIFFEVKGQGKNISYKWWVRKNSNESWSFLDKNKYEDIFSNKLKITDFDTTMVGNQYMVILETRGYQCGVKDTSDVVTISMKPDNDNDCVPDDVDLDDDNDGIYDLEEGTGDIDNDGIPNLFDLDSDGDNCFDVIEAGFSDGDEDGILCLSPVIVDSLGVVVECKAELECSPLNITNYNMVGSTQFISSDSSYLLTEQQNDQSGAVWSLDRIDLSKEFEVQAKLNLGSLTSNGADGIAFVLQPLSSNQGSLGGGIGYMGISPSLAVEFDTWKNSADPFDNDHAAIHLNGDISVYYNEIDLGEIEDGEYHDLLIKWNSSSNILEVYWDGSMIISYQNDIVSNVFNGNSNVYYGFTAATGGSINSQSVIIKGTCTASGLGQGVEDGYTDPLDLDLNGLKDYKEISVGPVITSDPQSVEVAVDRPASFSVSINYDGPLTYQWQLNLGNGWLNLEDTITYSGINSTTLSIDSVDQIMDGSMYRLMVSSALICSEPVFSSLAILNVLPDNDRDKIPDRDDLDDDNDGIYDLDEGDGDIDNDGIPNIFDLDSDNDGCFDAIEAGFQDSDNDGLLGMSPVEVNSLGVVTSNTSGYGTPEDRDNNTIYDFLEEGSSISIISNPSSVSIIETRDARYEITLNSVGTVLYQWQVSKDQGATWKNIQNDNVYSGSQSSTLILTDAPLEFNDYQFKVLVSTPAYLCDEDIESSVALTVLPDNDKDGIADEDDLDDDNDGILDIYEGIGDLDNDGIPNVFDLDSDNDGCSDVIESGCTDPDNDGILGVSPVKVDGLGVVVDKYIAKYDFSGNGDDSSGNGIHGILTKTLIGKDRFGIPSSSYLFDGQESIFKVFHDNILDLSIYDRFSISMWVKPNSSLNQNEKTVFIEKRDKDIGWSYHYSHDEDTTRIIFSDVTKSLIVSKEISLNVNDWYHLVIQKDNDIFTHFINGDTLVSISQNTSLNDNKSPLYVGGSGDLSMMFNGEIDDIIIAGNYGFCNYKEPRDDNDSGIYDFLEYGGPVVLDSVTESKLITEQTSTYFAVSSSSLSEISYLWQFSSDDGDSWINIEDSTFYSGFLSDTLRIINAPLSFNKNLYRVILSTPSFKCGEIINSSARELVVLPDNDVDGIPDSEDLDDDNDGIFDIDEGDGDLDGDGIINMFDLDSDGDGCYDVLEAGFYDSDIDGILGSSPVTVDDKGLVTSGGDGNGYKDPFDADGNLKPDYLDFGSEVFIITEPEDIYIVESIDTFVSVNARVPESETMVLYTWQVSQNGGMTWETISNSSNVLEIINADISYNDRIFRVVVSTPSFVCGKSVISDPFRIVVASDFDYDLIGDIDDLDDDNDGIYDSLECKNNSSLILRGDVDTIITSGYPIIANYTGNSGSGSGSQVFGNNINVTMLVPQGDIYEGCYFVSDLNFDDGIEVSIDGKTILSFNQYHWDVTRGKADPLLTTEFNGGLFGKNWLPWNSNVDIKLVIRDGSIKLYSETVDGSMVDVIPYMDNTVEGWVLDKNFKLSCREGFNLDIKNTNHNGPSSFVSQNTIYAYVCSDTDDDGDNNNRDLDSDNDDCFDVKEAGFIDQNNDGILGDLPTVVDSLGLVLNSGGYDIPVDNDENVVYDFLEEGFSVDIITSPESYNLIMEGDTFSLYVDLSLNNNFVYQWQVQDEYSLYWKNLSDTVIGLTSYSGSNTNNLKISGINFDDNQLENVFLSYRLIISSPAYLCEDDILTSPFEVEVYHKDLHIPNGFSPNNDGINDTWVIRGLEQYPNHRIRIYNIWNTRVFEKRNYENDWDGRNMTHLYFGDGRLPEGTYYYIFDLGNGKKPLKGFVFIKRD